MFYKIKIRIIIYIKKNFMKLKRTFLFTMFVVLSKMLTVSTLNAQVTIGILEVPEDGTLLQLKDVTGIIDDGVNAHKGFGLPRVALSNKNELYPMFLANPDNPASGPNAAYSTNKAALDKSHAGLIVYNIVEDDDKELCFGLNQWTGEEWQCFQSKMENAKFTPVMCSDIVAKGDYIEKTPVTSANYLAIKLNVTKPGAYAITARTENGYSFFLSGVALSLGEMMVYVPCQGTPVKVQFDDLVFSGIDLAQGCQPQVKVVSAVATYAINCTSVSVNGQYIKGTPLTSSNTITLSATVTNAGSYHIAVPTTHGVSFVATGTFANAGTHLITLLGSGSPTVNDDIAVTIHANTPAGNSSCNTTIPMTLPRMTYAIIGNDIWSWNTTARLNAFNSGSFGPNGVVKIVRLDQAWVTANVTTAADNLNSTTREKPDIVLYFAYGAAPNTALITALNRYVRDGGVLIFGSRDDQFGEVNNLMNGIFGAGTGTAVRQGGGSTDDNVYPVNINPNCPIINGPFGNLAGRHWGEDNAQTGSIILTELPPNSVQICTARSTTNTTRNPEHSIVWYNESFNFLYFGDSVGAAINNTTQDAYPSSFTSGGLPQSKLYGPPPATNRQWVVNSAMELNGVAWALKKAAVSGINPH